MVKIVEWKKRVYERHELNEEGKETLLQAADRYNRVKTNSNLLALLYKTVRELLGKV